MASKKKKIFVTAFSAYTELRACGEGGAGQVYEVIDESQNRFALKLLDPGKANREKIKRFKNEIFFGIKNTHQNIIAVIDHGVFNSGENSSPFYVMPFCTGSLRSLLEAHIPPDKVLLYYSQILDGVEAAHLLNRTYAKAQLNVFCGLK